MEAGGLGMGCGDQQYRAKPATDRSGLLVLRELLDAALASDVLASSVPARHARNNVAMPARSVLVVGLYSLTPYSLVPSNNEGSGYAKSALHSRPSL